MRIKCECDDKLCARWHPAIEASMRKAVARGGRGKKGHEIDMTALARDVGISRPTLYRHAPFVEHLLQKLKVERRRSDGDAARLAMEQRIERIQAQREQAEEELMALRRTLAEIFQTLVLHAKPLAAMVEAELHERGIKTGACPLCGGTAGSIATRRHPKCTIQSPR